MKTIIGLRYKPVGKIYYFDPNGEMFEVGDGVIVESVRGVEYATVVVANKQVEDESLKYELKPILRKATDDDRIKNQENQIKEERAFEITQQKIKEHKLDMKLLSVEYNFDGAKILFNFAAEQRVDFRELVRDLASTFHTRIELRQVGVRDEAKLVSGLASCGRECCCASWKGGFDTVSIKMAKNQDLALNPAKISGMCGRLMCCLSYEEPTYKELRKSLPRVGHKVIYKGEEAEVVSMNILSQKVRVKYYVEKDDSFTFEWATREEISYAPKK